MWPDLLALDASDRCAGDAACGCAECLAGEPQRAALPLKLGSDRWVTHHVPSHVLQSRKLRHAFQGPRPRQCGPPSRRRVDERDRRRIVELPRMAGPMTQLWVPRLSPDHDGSPYLLGPVRLALAASSAAVDQAAWQDPSAKHQLAGLMAAAWCDLGGAATQIVASKLEYAGSEPKRSARRAAQRGRKLWWRLNVWPWCSMPAYQADWWLGQEVAELWDVWRDPKRWRHSWWVRRGAS